MADSAAAMATPTPPPPPPPPPPLPPLPSKLDRSSGDGGSHQTTTVSSLERRLPSAAELIAQLEQTVAAVEAFGAAHSHVDNIGKLSRRVRRELRSLQEAAAAAGGSPLSSARLQGAANNLRGFRGELDAAAAASGVVAVAKKFYTSAPQVWAPCCSLSQRPTHAGGSGGGSGSGCDGAEDDASSDDGAVSTTSSATSGSSSKGGGGRGGSGSSPPPRRTFPSPAAAAAAAPAAPAGVVEVDVVAHGGALWIEAKSQEPFGVASLHFAGAREQARALLAAAAAPHNHHRYAPPRVAFLFCGGGADGNNDGNSDGGVDPGVRAALEGMGVVVAAGSGDLAKALPPPPPLPPVVALDVTALCAVVSEVSHVRGAGDARRLEAWAARTVHWRECLAAEVAAPLLPQLPLAASVWQTGDSGDEEQQQQPQQQQLVASCLAVQQFDALAASFAGPAEAARWARLRGRLQVYHTRAAAAAAAPAAPASSSSSRAGSTFAGVSGGGGGGGGGGGSVSLQEGCRCCACGAPLGGGEGGLGEGRPLAVDEPPALAAALLLGGGSSSSAPPPSAASSSSSAAAAASVATAARQKLGPLPRSMLAVAEALQALTLTANGGAVRAAEAAGVPCTAVVHRPVWLAGV